jgi:hypothetical protein
LLSSHCRYSSIIMPVHFVLLYRYSMRKSFRLIFLKQRGLFDLPIHQTCSFFLEAETVNTSVIRSLLFFPPLLAYVASVRLGVSFQKRPVSSILRILSSWYLEQSCRIYSIWAIASGLLISTEAASPW